MLGLIKKSTNNIQKNNTGCQILLKEVIYSVDERSQVIISIHVIGKIFESEAREDYSQIAVQYNSYYEDIVLDYARTINKNKEVFNTSNDAIQIKNLPEFGGNIIYTDTRLLTFSFPALEIGSIFEYQVTVKQKLPVIENEWYESINFNYLQYNTHIPSFIRIDPVIKSRIVVKVPANKQFISKLSDIEIKPELKKENKIDIYIWETTNLPGIKFEIGMPPVFESVPYLSITSIADWKIVNKWAYEKLIPKIEINTDIKEKANEITAVYDSLTDKINAIYNFIQREIVYIQADLNRGGYEPHRASAILRNRYGDCKDKSVLFISLLNAIGIEAFPALIRPFPSEDVRTDIPSMFFSHIITCLPAEKANIWLDPTSNTAVYPTLPYEDEKRLSLIINDKEGILLRTPSSLAEENVGLFDISYGFINQHGQAELNISATGAINDDLKSSFKSYLPAQRHDMINDMIKSLNTKIKIDTIQISDLNDPKICFNVHSKFSLENIFRPGMFSFTFSSNAVLSLPFFSFLHKLPPPKDRKNDFYFPYRYTIISHENFSRPAFDYIPGILPTDDSLATDFLVFYRKFNTINDTIKVNWALTIKEGRIGIDKYSEFYENIQKVLEKLLFNVSFIKKTSSYRKNHYPTGYSLFGSNNLFNDLYTYVANWVPVGKNKVLGNHPEIGIGIGIDKNHFAASLLIGIKFLSSKNYYYVYHEEQLLKTNHFFGGFIGGDFKYKLYRGTTYSFNLLGGLGFDGFDAITKTKEHNAKSINSFNLNTGLSVSYVFKKLYSPYLDFQVRYNFVDYDTNGGTDLSGNILLIRLVLGLLLQ